MSSTNLDSNGQMRGWFKLIETIRKTDPPVSTSTETLKSSLNIETDTNGHEIASPEHIHMDNHSSHITDSTPLIKIEPTTVISDAKRPKIRHKKITIRKSSKSKLLTTEDNKPISNDSLPNNSIIPLATDLQSLPGYDQDDLRDQRFLDYKDINTLIMHLNTCLHIDKKSFSSAHTMKQHIFKTRHNVLNKIFKLSFIKTWKESSNFDNIFSFNKIDHSKMNLSSTSMSFKTDWSVNRRSTTTHRREPKNLFHILQLNPKKDFSLSINKHENVKQLSNEQQQKLDYEHMKTTLIRAYYPHFHIAVQNRLLFSSLPKINSNNFQFSTINDETTTNRQWSFLTFDNENKTRKHRIKYKQNDNQPLPKKPIERRVSEEIPPAIIEEPIVILSSPTSSSEKETNNNNKSRKRKTSNVNETKRKKFQRLPSPEIIDNHVDISFSDSDEDLLPNELPKQNFIKNGLCSNYYKIDDEINSKNINNKTRKNHQRQYFNGSMPPIYSGLYKNENEILSYIDYKLPYDIYWFSEKQMSLKTNSSRLSSKRKCLIKHKVQYDLIDDRNLQKFTELTKSERDFVLKTSIFLLRNIRKIKEKKQNKDKNNNQQKQHIDETILPLFFAQNYYHSNIINNQNENLSISHKDLLNLFYNHIRRSHFAKTGQYTIELIDPNCYYAQLGQLTLVLNNIFDLLLHYKCQTGDVYPSNALKKCPLKRLFPMYYELISKPIDLTMIRNKLDNAEYVSYDLFEQDLLLLFQNAITYCGDDSDVGRAVNELKIYFIDILKIDFQFTIDLFKNMNKNHQIQPNVNIFQSFLKTFHENEIFNGTIREIIYDLMATIDENSTIVYKTVLVNATNAHRTSKAVPTNDSIVHCRCGSVFDETMLVQCYACQLWQHMSCVTINKSDRIYFCFECRPKCENDHSLCLKTNVRIPLQSTQILNDNHQSYSIITRSDGLIIRVNECYFILKQDENVESSIQYDIFSIERIWIDDNENIKASGFYYLRPNETFHEVNRKFFSNELFRFPSTNDSIDINLIVRPCYVFDAITYCKGKPISEYSSRISSNDLFICEYRVDKSARTFTRLPKSKHIYNNTKSYCFDNYLEKLSIKRDYQSHQQTTTRRRSLTYPIKLTSKQLEEKSSHIDGIIEKIYCQFHNANLIPSETKYSPNCIIQQTKIRGSKRLRDKHVTSSIIINKKPCKRSVLNHDNKVESTNDDNQQQIILSLIDELIGKISSYTF